MSITQTPPTASPSDDGRPSIGSPELLRDRWHRYTWEGETLGSVTTICGLLSKGDALQYWAAGCTADYVIELVNSITDETAEVVIQQLTDRETLRTRFVEQREGKARRGTRLHYIPEQIAQGLPINLNLYTEEDQLAARNLIGFCEQFCLRTLFTESPCLSPSWGYAGTADWLGVADFGDGDAPWLLDWKSGDSVYTPRDKGSIIYPIEHAMQLAALAATDGWYCSRRQQLIPWPPQDIRLGVVHVNNERVALYDWTALRDVAEAAFLSLLQVYHIQRDTTRKLIPKEVLRYGT